MSKPVVSVIIPTFNSQNIIGRLLDSIDKQSYKNLETIIVDDGSKDQTVKIANNYSVKIFSRNHAERSVQRNFGAKKSNGKFLLFLDSDMELTKNVIADCVNEASNDIKIGAIVIPEISIARTFWEKVKAFERSFYNKSGDDITDSARFFPKSVFEKVGGYDESITGPEDWDLPETVRKFGYKTGRVKSVIYHYEKIRSLFSLVAKKYYYALKTHRYLSKHQISLISAKTIYFLRPVFYKNWKKILKHPILSTAMFFMLFVEMMAGGSGYIIGRLKDI